jgi:hypothetical protein
LYHIDMEPDRIFSLLMLKFFTPHPITTQSLDGRGLGRG